MTCNPANDAPYWKAVCPDGTDFRSGVLGGDENRNHALALRCAGLLFGIS